VTTILYFQIQTQQKLLKFNYVKPSDSQNMNEKWDNHHSSWFSSSKPQAQMQVFKTEATAGQWSSTRKEHINAHQQALYLCLQVVSILIY